MARRALELEGLEHPLLGLRAVEDAVEAVGVLAVAVDEPPTAAVTRLPDLDLHDVLAGPEPLLEELGVDVRPIDQRSRRGELALDVDERHAFGGGDPGGSHRGTLLSVDGGDLQRSS